MWQSKIGLMVALLLVCAEAATALSSADFSARAVITSTNGIVRTVPLVATVEPDGGRRVTVKAADTQGAKWVDIHVDCATARTGDDGYWITQRGLLGYFTRKSGASEPGRNWLTLPYFGMKTPNVSFLAVMEGMRFEFDVRVIVEKGVYRRLEV